jgi:hypothetical protein
LWEAIVVKNVQLGMLFALVVVGSTGSDARCQTDEKRTLKHGAHERTYILREFFKRHPKPWTVQPPNVARHAAPGCCAWSLGRLQTRTLHEPSGRRSGV